METFKFKSEEKLYKLLINTNSYSFIYSNRKNIERIGKYIDPFIPVKKNFDFLEFKHSDKKVTFIPSSDHFDDLEFIMI